MIRLLSYFAELIKYLFHLVSRITEFFKIFLIIEDYVIKLIVTCCSELIK